MTLQCVFHRRHSNFHCQFHSPSFCLIWNYLLRWKTLSKHFYFREYKSIFWEIILYLLCVNVVLRGTFYFPPLLPCYSLHRFHCRRSKVSRSKKKKKQGRIKVNEGRKWQKANMACDKLYIKQIVTTHNPPRTNTIASKTVETSL